MIDLLVVLIAYTMNIAVGIFTNGEWKTAGYSVAHYYWRMAEPRKNA